jgi:hypothetical protein
METIKIEQCKIESFNSNEPKRLYRPDEHALYAKVVVRLQSTKRTTSRIAIRRAGSEEMFDIVNGAICYRVFNSETYTLNHLDEIVIFKCDKDVLVRIEAIETIRL